VRFDFGEVFAKSVTALLPSLVVCAVIMLVLKTPTIYAGIKDLGNPVPLAFADTGQWLAWTALDWLLQPLGSAFVAYSVYSRIAGRPASIGDTFSAVLSRIVPVVLVGFFWTLATTLGCAALIAPGAFLMSLLWVALPAAVIERESGILDAIGRSVELTRGVRWWIVLLAVVLSLILGLVSLVPAMALAFTTNVAIQVVIVAGIAIINPIWMAAAQASAYHHLRTLKETADVDQIASVFD
jgi:hypothetical protein